jgi:Rrf2 family transcriptional regulator, cysteine metabolism repressor
VPGNESGDEDLDQGEYGIRAMLYLAQHAGPTAVTSHEIARHQGIPEPYLRQILAQLSKTGLILSNRGPQGGHLLARPADEVTIRDVIVPLEGQTTSVDQILALRCTIEGGAEHCPIRELLLSVKRAVDDILTATTLADLARRQSELLAGHPEAPAIPQAVRELPEKNPLPVLG